MRGERTKAERLAFALEFLVKEGHAPGLLPEQVLEAATLLREQEKRLTEQDAALATKEHHVSVEIAERTPYQTEIRAAFTIADPRRYWAMAVEDSYIWETADQDYHMMQARVLVNRAHAGWRHELEEKTFRALAQAIEARRAETVQQGSVGDESAVA